MIIIRGRMGILTCIMDPVPQKLRIKSLRVFHKTHMVFLGKGVFSGSCRRNRLDYKGPF